MKVWIEGPVKASCALPSQERASEASASALVWTQCRETEAHKVRMGKQLENLPAGEWEHEYQFKDCWTHDIEIVGRGKLDDDEWECTE